MPFSRGVTGGPFTKVESNHLGAEVGDHNKRGQQQECHIGEQDTDEGERRTKCNQDWEDHNSQQ